ncbi:PREDICTED: mucin-12 [Bactrocera latifrons]|uniref:Zinc finger CCHC domain-containing protein 2 n=2 Tax=Bactrocera latifrons TaxID=174628 RepID=A0A0K8U4Z9_BACLA|nr:PREDICTED: mucin-12 [Bactrocera latifrons]
MICKKDVIQWFKELESYKRIDTMCTLLNMCLPFELRFLGTCLEELGRRDSQELRGMELRVNNPQDLASDMVACQKGEPTDKKIRRKMALYLALIRACNRTCVTEIFRTLDGWGDRDFLNMNDSDTLQELLLVYTMAANHPVFSFDQQCKCTQIFEKIKENKLVADFQSPLPQQPSIDPTLVHTQHQQEPRQHLPPSHQEIPQQLLHAMHIPGQPHPQILTPVNIMPMTFPQGLHKIIQADGTMQHPVPVDPHMIPLNVIPTESNPIFQPTWQRMYPHTVEHPPQSASPMLSQQSSPSSSRTTSPNRNASSNMMLPGMQLQSRNIPQRMSASLKNVRRPSAETTPPPMGQQQHQQLIHDINMTTNIKNIDDAVASNEGTGNPLQALIRNGYPRRHKSGNYTPLIHQQQQQLAVNPHFQPVANFAGLAYSMQNMSMSDGTGTGLDTTLVPGSLNANKSGGSDTGSSNGSCGDASPPETPTLSGTTNVPGLRLGNENQLQKHQQLGYNKQTGNTRLNGRSDKMISANVVVNSVSTTASGMYTTPMMNTHPALTQQSQPMYGAEIILASGSNAGGIGLMQTSLANNNNSGGIGNNIAVVNTTSNIGTSNNNLATNPVLMSSPSPGVASGGGSIITNMTPNPLILPTPHQQQYNATYPYHAAPTAQHQRLMSHTGGPAPPQLRLMPNEHIYSYYQIPGAAPPGAPPLALRPTNALPPPPNTNVTSGVTGVLQVQQQQPTAQALQTNPTIVASPTILTGGTPYSTQAAQIVSNKHLSCYNCGSQSHSGPDCQEASMEDVTRSAIYKLDYSGSSSASPTVSSGANSVTVGSAGAGGIGGAAAGGAGGGGGGVGSGGSSGGGGAITDSLQIQHHPQQQHHQKQHTVEVTGATLVGTQSSATTLHSSTPVASALNTK